MRERHTPVRAAVLLLGALSLTLGCGDGATAKQPPEQSIETAESVSRSATIPAPFNTTPTNDDTDETSIALNARIFGAGPTGVILAHGRPADQTSWFPFATKLAAAGGFTVMTFDFRGYGDSTGDKAFDRSDTDLMAAYDYMRQTLGVSRIFLVGASTAGTAAFVVAARVPVAGVISISSPAQFESLDALGAVSQINAPKLFITSKGDVPAERSERDLLDAASEPKDEQVYEGNANGTDLFAGPHADELDQRLLEFLEHS
ncbi:MAG: alpha/beta hydrolase [Chloroflexota bacterium]|nr:alpha/beta hydrolase [Chloroflexota bacterium]